MNSKYFRREKHEWYSVDHLQVSQYPFELSIKTFISCLLVNNLDFVVT